jgi:hypothetical protein
MAAQSWSTKPSRWHHAKTADLVAEAVVEDFEVVEAVDIEEVVVEDEEEMTAADGIGKRICL